MKQINLLPREYQLPPKRLIKQLACAAFIILAVAASLVFFWSHLAYLEKEYGAVVDQRKELGQLIEERDVIKTEVEQLEKKLHYMEYYAVHQGFHADFLKGIQEVLPSEIFLTSLYCTETMTVLEGQADNFEQVSRFADGIRILPNADRVMLSHTEKEENLIIFELIIEIL